MPPGMRAFVTFMFIAFFSVALLSVVHSTHLISGRTYMICFYATGAIAGLAAWLQMRRPVRNAK